MNVKTFFNFKLALSVVSTIENIISVCSYCSLSMAGILIVKSENFVFMKRLCWEATAAPFQLPGF